MKQAILLKALKRKKRSAAPDPDGDRIEMYAYFKKTVYGGCPKIDLKILEREG